MRVGRVAFDALRNGKWSTGHVVGKSGSQGRSSKVELGLLGSSEQSSMYGKKHAESSRYGLSEGVDALKRLVVYASPLEAEDAGRMGGSIVLGLFKYGPLALDGRKEGRRECGY